MGCTCSLLHFSPGLELPNSAWGDVCEYWTFEVLVYHLNLKLGESARGSHGLRNVILYNKNIFGRWMDDGIA